MACKRVDLTVLVVDDDDTSLAIVTNILSSWDYKVQTTNNARNALKILREFEGFFDLVITEVHISGMNGFELQKRVKDEFQLPVIMMSMDNRKSVMAKSLENGASRYLLKPLGADDFNDIWKYARKGKVVIENNELRSGEAESSPGEKIIIQDVNSSAVSSTLTQETKGRKKYNGKRNKEDQCEGSSQVQKKPKIVWTTYLHNLFLMAIKHIGLEKAVPKKILDVMNVPYLTRENVASHLQKYRLFLKKVAEKGLLEGLSTRTLKSRFATGLSASVIKEIQERSERLRFPVQEYLKNLSHNQTQNGGTTANAPKPPSNQGPIHLHNQQVPNSAYVTTQLGNNQFPNPLYKGLMPQNQQGFNGYSSLNQVNNMQQNMLGSYANYPVYQANPGPIFPSYGNGHGLMTSAHGLTRNLYQNSGLLGNQSFKYGLGNGNMNMASSSSSNVPRNNSTCFPSSNSCGTPQLNGGIGPQMVGTGINGRFNSVGVKAPIANNNSFGLVNNGTQNANMNVAMTPNLGNGNSGLVNGFSASASASGGRNGDVSEVPAAALMSNATGVENINSGIPQLPQQQDGIGNVAGNENYHNGSSIGEGNTSQLEDDLSDLFLMVEDMHLLIETKESTPDVSECLNSDFPSSSVMQSLELEQPQTEARDVIVPPTESDINQQNESPTSSDKTPNQGSDGSVDWEEPFDRLLGDIVSSGSNSVIEQDWDMERIEAFFAS